MWLLPICRAHNQLFSAPSLMVNAVSNAAAPKRKPQLDGLATVVVAITICTKCPSRGRSTTSITTVGAPIEMNVAAKVEVDVTVDAVAKGAVVADLEAAENQACPTGAITRRFVETPYYEYTIDEELCNGCGKCALDAAEGLIGIVDGLAVIDYTKHGLEAPDATKRCPTGAIAWAWPSWTGPAS